MSYAPDFDPYEILKVARDANASTIKSAWRKLLMDPANSFDRARGAALQAGKSEAIANAAGDKGKAAAQALHNAYDILKDPQKRAAFDRFGIRAFANGNTAGAAAAAAAAARDPFAGFGGGSRSGFGGGGGPRDPFGFDDIFKGGRGTGAPKPPPSAGDARNQLIGGIAFIGVAALAVVAYGYYNKKKNEKKAEPLRQRPANWTAYVTQPPMGGQQFQR